ncbi:MAG: Panacea domain-containing protein [Treponema sp.]|nr:Panacea domain-containing protein [Treponema sp.]
MLPYRKERIDNAILFFARKHRQKTHKYLSQTFLYKYLAFFEFRYLKKAGDMPLELTYRAMEHGPVPIEIYDNRGNPGYFSKVVFEPSPMENGKTRYTVKPVPAKKFEPDFFAEAELEEMGSLIEIFAQRWVKAAEISEASHQDIKAWKSTYSRSPNAVIDPAEEFGRDISAVSEDMLSTEELKYLMRRKIAGLAV